MHLFSVQSQDDIAKADKDAPAGSLTVAKGNVKMNCKVAQSTDCSAAGPVGANYGKSHVRKRYQRTCANFTSQ